MPWGPQRLRTVTPSLLSSPRPVSCPRDVEVSGTWGGAGKRGAHRLLCRPRWLRASPALVLAECPAALGQLPCSLHVHGEGPHAPPATRPGPGAAAERGPSHAGRGARLAPHLTEEETARAEPARVLLLLSASSKCPAGPLSLSPVCRRGRGPVAHPGRTASLPERPWGGAAGSTGRPWHGPGGPARATGHRARRPRAVLAEGTGPASRRSPLPTLPLICHMNASAPRVRGAVTGVIGNEGTKRMNRVTFIALLHFYNKFYSST